MLNQQKLIAHRSGGWKSKVKVLAGSVSAGASPWFAGGHPVRVFTVCMAVPRFPLL